MQGLCVCVSGMGVDVLRVCLGLFVVVLYMCCGFVSSERKDKNLCCKEQQWWVSLRTWGRDVGRRGW